MSKLPFNTNENDKYYKDDIYYKFNGAVYLVKHTTITRQYIGSGETLKLALKDAENTIIKNGFVPNEYFVNEIKKETEACRN